MKFIWMILGFVLVLIIAANVIPILWPMAVDAGGNITAMTGTDTGTTFFKSFWPLIITIGGIVISVSLLAYAIKSGKLKIGGINL